MKLPKTKTTNVLATLALCAGLGANADTLRVEIPMRDGHVDHLQTLKLKQMIRNRTHVDPSRYDLRAVVLRARSYRHGHAQLRVDGYRSARFNIPSVSSDRSPRLRIGSPHPGAEGPWQLKIAGDVRIEKLVAVLEPRYDHHARIGSRSSVYTSHRYTSHQQPSVTYRNHEHRYSGSRHWSDDAGAWVGGYLLGRLHQDAKDDRRRQQRRADRRETRREIAREVARDERRAERRTERRTERRRAEREVARREERAEREQTRRAERREERRAEQPESRRAERNNRVAGGTGNRQHYALR